MRLVLTLVAASALLAACGGGGGGGTPPSAALPDPTAPVATGATLTSANYVAVAQETLSSSAYLTATTGLVTGAQVSDPEVLIRFGRAQLSKVPGWLANAPAQAVGAVQTETGSCDGGGSLSTAANDANGNLRVDAGDSAALTLNNCGFEGQVLNGKLVLTVISVTGNPDDGPPYSLSVNLAFDNLTAQSPSVTSVGNGSMAMALTARGSNDQSLSLGTPSFALSTTYGGTTYGKVLTNYETSVEERPVDSGFTSTVSVKGTLSSSAFESKSISVATPTPFVTTSGQGYPGSGQLIVTGAAGSTLRITATNATTVLLELDADANGSYETIISKPWSEML